MSEMPQEQGSKKNQTYVIGAAGGLVLGLLAAYLFLRTLEETADPNHRVGTGDALKLTIAIVTLMRQISALGR